MDEHMQRIQRLAGQHLHTEDQVASARAEWPVKAETLLPYVRQLFQPLMEQHGVIAFNAPDGLTLVLKTRVEDLIDRQKHERGARCRFDVNDAGQLVGYMIPDEGHGLYSTGWKSFINLGPVAGVTENMLGGAVCEWLEWAVGGAGRSRFVVPLPSSPPPPPDLPPLPPLA